ncbi:MAG TPA: acetate--CoA ligase family protein [Syntrophorhabdaceae bacterium]
MNSMKSMFFPDTVAIIGVSNSPANNGKIIVENMDRFGFKGTLYLVGGRRDFLGARPIYSGIREIPVVPDLTVILIPARGLRETLEECGEKGIRQVVIETGGFSEFGEERKGLEEEILKVAHKWGMQIIGPNCVGIVNVENGLILPFYPLYPHEAEKGPVSVVSQSGGLVHDIIILSNTENVGVNKLVSIGNKLVCDENDILEYLISDPTTDMIGLYLENIRDGRRLMDLAASTAKPLILLKSNRSPGSTHIAKFHTSALAGDDRVGDEALKQAGIIRVGNLPEMVNCFKAFTLPPLKGRRLAVMARSGGHAVLAADSVYLHGFTLASFSDEFFGMLSEKTRAGVIRRTNPLDLGDVFDFNVYMEITEKALKEEGVDGVLLLHSYALGGDLEPTLNYIASCGSLTRKYGKPIIFCTVPHREHLLTLREVKEFPIFNQVDDALAAVWKAYLHHRSIEEASSGRDRVRYKEGRALPPRLPEGVMAPAEVFELLKNFDLQVVDYKVADGLESGIKAARELGYPVALKTASPNILHKTEKGGVLLNLVDEPALSLAFGSMEADSYLLQKMAPTGLEIIIGGKYDSEFGPVVLCGMGGIFVEVYKDVSLRVAPVDEKGAREMIESLKGAPILTGFRGRPGYDLEYLVTALVRVSTLLVSHPEIGALDINPLILFEEGKGGVIVDGKIEVR